MSSIADLQSDGSIRCSPDILDFAGQRTICIRPFAKKRQCPRDFFGVALNHSPQALDASAAPGFDVDSFEKTDCDEQVDGAYAFLFAQHLLRRAHHALLYRQFAALLHKTCSTLGAA